MKKILLALAVCVAAVGIVGATAFAGSPDDACCCVTTDNGALVCTLTGEIQETCCCE